MIFPANHALLPKAYSERVDVKASIGAEMESWQGVAHIDFPAARCRLVVGKVRNSLIEFYFLFADAIFSASVT